MRVYYTLVRSRTPVVNPETLFQLVAASNHRIEVLGMDISCQGNTPANAPPVFDLLTQSDAGNSGTSPTTLTPQLVDRGQDETIQGAAAAYDGSSPTEPTPGVRIWEESIHEQGTLQWRPPRPFVVKGGERIGLRYKRATFVAVSVTIYCEE